MGESHSLDPPDPCHTTPPPGKELQSAKSTRRLNQIDRVRANGIGDHVSLPQLVVCGDQSAGKSSVLQGITGIPFPREHGLCTRFATEIILRHDLTTTSITATLIPHASRSEDQKERMAGYYRSLSSFAELPDVITAVLELMQLRGSGTPATTTGPSFSADILRIEVVGQTGLHLTVVDLPGLISVANDEQTEADVALVSTLVDEYLAMERTIILAVVQATNDIANQAIIQRARKFDPHGRRTVGIITIPDLVNRGTEGRVALLARNEDTTKLKLGFFLVKNPSPSEMDAGSESGNGGLGAEEWKRREQAFFFSSSPWKEQQLERDRVGVDALTSFLQSLLDAHIERELPKVRCEVTGLLAQTRQKLEAMGEERPTVGHLRMYLTRLSMRFVALCQAALDGNYLELDRELANCSYGNKPDMSYRLRAQSHILNGEFSETLRRHGNNRRLVCNDESDIGEESDDNVTNDEDGELDSWIKEVYKRTRGRELPGNYNHFLLAELFKEQSSRWEKISRDHIGKINTLVQKFVAKVLEKLVTEDEVRDQLHQHVSDDLETCFEKANGELDNILADEQRAPMTYNHYYTDNIQRSRQDSMRRSIRATMLDSIEKDWEGSLHIRNNGYDRDRLIESLEKRVLVDMDDQACKEARVGLEAYYKVARKTFVDNVCRQVVERHVLSKLPDLFSPTVVTNFSDEDLTRIAAEPAAQKEKRARLVKLADGLQDSLRELRI